MNKRILYITLISIALQLIKLLFVYKGVNSIWLTELIIIFLIIAIPIVFIQLFRDRNQSKNKNLKNVIGVFLIFPSIIFAMLIYKVLFYNISETEIDPNTIKIYDKENREIPIDSLLFIIEKDSNKINSINLE